MHKEKSKNIKIRIILPLVFAVLATALLLLINIRKNHTEQQQLQLTTDKYQLAYSTIYDQYRQLATNIYSGTMDRFDIQGLYQKLSTADEGQKDSLRQELYTSLNPRYIKLQREAKVRQLHFHLKNNEAFLRFHRPEHFGDNLTEIRETVNYVNTTHLPIDGFEEGRIYNGYRFVFPITAADQSHLGSIEISFGPEVFTSAMMKQYVVLSNFFIKEEVIRRKVYPDSQEQMYSQSHHKGYLYDKNVLAALKEVSLQDMKKLKPQEGTTSAIFSNIQSGQAMSIYDSSIDMVFTTIPVFNPVS